MAVEAVAEYHLSLEDALARLEGLTEDLARGMGLEEEVEKFVLGRELLARCEDALRELEARFADAQTAEVHGPTPKPRPDSHGFPGEGPAEPSRERDRFGESGGRKSAECVRI